MPLLPATRLRLNLRQLEVFVATARSGTTRGAGERVARSQSAASSSLAALEAALGVALFDRIGRRLVLNENGRALLPRAGSLLAEAAELEKLFSGKHQTPLQIAASLTIGEFILPGLLARWKASHPSSPVLMRINNTSEVIAAVAGFEVDLGFIEGPQTHPDLMVRPWLADQLAIVAAPGNPLAGGMATPRQLRQAEWALRERGSGTREAADRWLVEQLGPVVVGFELGSSEAIERVVASGTALGFLSRHAVVEALASGRLAEVRTRLPAATRRLAIVLHRDRRLASGAEEFLQLCTADSTMKTASTEMPATSHP